MGKNLFIICVIALFSSVLYALGIAIITGALEPVKSSTLSSELGVVGCTIIGIAIFFTFMFLLILVISLIHDTKDTINQINKK